MLSDFGYTTVERLNCSTRTITVRAIRNSDQRRVIVKSLASPHPTATQLARFNYACELQKRFDHPGIVTVLDWIAAPSSPYMVLEDIGAMPLSEFMEQQPEGRLSIDVFLGIALQISTALAEIHRLHVIHKDLHPGNILVHPRTLQVQITDFDLSSLLSREQPAVQPPSTLEGALAFLSPEQTGRMNRSVLDAGGEALLVSQFTLAADTHSGLRPSFTPAAEPAEARRLFDHALARSRTYPLRVATGEFGADMQVALINDGPVTFSLRVAPDN